MHGCKRGCKPSQIVSALAWLLVAACILEALALGAGPKADEKGGFPPQAQETAEETADGVAPHPHAWNKSDIAVALISTAGVVVVGIVPIVLMWKSRRRERARRGDQ